MGSEVMVVLFCRETVLGLALSVGSCFSPAVEGYGSGSDDRGGGEIYRWVIGDCICAGSRIGAFGPGLGLDSGLRGESRPEDTGRVIDGEWWEGKVGGGPSGVSEMGRCVEGENCCEGRVCDVAEGGLSLGRNKWFGACGFITDWSECERCCAKTAWCSGCRGPALMGCGVYGDANGPEAFGGWEL